MTIRPFREIRSLDRDLVASLGGAERVRRIGTLPRRATRCLNTRHLVWSLWLVLGHAIALVAAPPDKITAPAASGVYGASGPEAMFAFRVDPWSAGMHHVRGVGRASVEGPAAADVYFEILGTYLPDQSQRASGLLLYREGKAIASVPWQGSFDAKSDSLNWNAEVGSRSLPLPPVQSLFAKGSGNSGPPDRKAVLKIKGKRKPIPAADDTLSDKDGALDFAKVITAVLELEPSPTSSGADKPAEEAPSPEQPPPPEPTPPEGASKSPRTPDVDDMIIIEAITQLGAGKKQSAGPYTPKDLLDNTLRRSIPASGRRTYPPVTTTPEVKQPTTPEEPRAPARVVPNLVGMKFETAVNQIWIRGLNPSSVDCLGPAKTQAQAERVVAQTPPAGSPFPPDRNMRLQWYGPMEREPESTDGFLPTDGPKVDIRFAEAKVAQKGRAIGSANAKGKEGYAWGIMPADDPAFETTRAGVARRMTDKSTSAVTIEVTMQKEAPDDFGFEHSSRANFNGAIFDTTELHRIVEYRGFVIYYFHKREGLHQPIAAVAETVVENSRRLIDLRFPEKATAP